MPHIPQAVLDKCPTLPTTLKHRGKVRDSYHLPGHHDKMLVMVSDRISAFDFVLNGIVPEKGAVLNAMNHFWTNKVIRGICETDLIAAGSEIDQYLPESLRNNQGLQKVATVVKVCPTTEIEDVVRLCITGSGIESYKATGVVCGHKLPPDLMDGNSLPYPIYTPTTKAMVGHDEPMTAEEVAEKYGASRERLALQLTLAAAKYAESRGIILADTKFELSQETSPEKKWVVMDEKLTPDSSRFWDRGDWIEAQAKGKVPNSFDKQFVRNWAKTVCIDKAADGGKRDPVDMGDLAYVDTQEIPSHVIAATTHLYRYIFWRLTGLRLGVYQHSKMNIDVETKQRKIQVIVGSESDLFQTRPGIASMLGIADVEINIISCHRNPLTLWNFLNSKRDTTDVIIAGAGKAAQLPGMVKAHLCAVNHHEIPVIGVAFDSQDERDRMAAKLSIECLPGNPVELSPDGQAYFGHDGFLQACMSATSHEFMPKSMEARPARFAINKELLPSH